MNRSLMAGAALALSIIAPACVAAQQAVPAMPEAQKPIRVSGLGLNVSDIERSKDFYTEVLGLQVDARVPASGEAREYLLGLTGVLQADTLVVLTAGEVVEGATGFGRVVIVVPNGRAMAERAQAAGARVRGEIRDGTNFIYDPDGYLIELYQRPG